MKAPERLRNAAEALAEVLPDARHRLLEGQSHNVSMKALAPVLEEFFSVSHPVPEAVGAAAGPGRR